MEIAEKEYIRLKRDSRLLEECICWILEAAEFEGYSSSIELFKGLGFAEEDLIEYGIRDFEFEYELYCDRFNREHIAENPSPEPLGYDEWFAEEYGEKMLDK